MFVEISCGSPIRFKRLSSPSETHRYTYAVTITPKNPRAWDEGINFVVTVATRIPNLRGVRGLMERYFSDFIISEIELKKD